MENISDNNKAGIKRKEKGNSKTKAEESYFDHFKNFILESDHPCLMAQAVVKASRAACKVYKEFDQVETTHTLKNDLDKFVVKHGNDNENFRSFVAIFPDFRIYNEIDLEKLLWKRLQLLQDVAVKNSSWDQPLNADPKEPNFSFSIAGKMFYVVGLHPKSSKNSRKAPAPTLIFNLYDQFERLKEDEGIFHEIRNKIRHRDYMVQGFINPLERGIGVGYKARQYRRRIVESRRYPAQQNR